MRCLTLAVVLMCALSLPGLAAATELNTANQAELEMIKGVGPQLSEQWLAARQQRPFASWAQFIERTPGVGPARAKRLSDAGLRVNGLAYSATPATATSGANTGATSANAAAPSAPAAPSPAEAARR
jgi:competence protein ComEA